MAIEIKEYINSKINFTETMKKTNTINLSESLMVDDPVDENSLMADIEGIHVGPTRNFTWYTEQALLSSKPTWTRPYYRPVIMHHNEDDGKVIGRVRHAEYVTINTRSGTPAMIFTCNIPDKEGKEQIKDGRLKTVSIGIIAHDVRCSICGEPITQVHEDGSADCGHIKGFSYDNQICYWMIYEMEAKELSFVIVPSDIYTHILKTYSPSKSISNIKESNQKGVLNLEENLKQNIINEELKNTENVANKVVDNVDLEKDLETLKAENQDLINSLEETKNLLIEATTKIEKLEEDIAKKDSDFVSEKQLKESAENQLIELKVQLKESLINNLIDLRESLNKQPIAKEILSTRSEESLRDSIKDLKEESGVQSTLLSIKESNNPSLNTEFQKNKEDDVKETKTSSNINLEEGLMDVVNSFFKTTRY